MMNAPTYKHVPPERYHHTFGHPLHALPPLSLRHPLPSPDVFRKIQVGPNATAHPFDNLAHLPYAINAYGLVRRVPDTPECPWPENAGDVAAVEAHLAAYQAEQPWHIRHTPPILRSVPRRPCAPLDPAEVERQLLPLPALHSLPPTVDIILPPLPPQPFDVRIMPESLRGTGLRYTVMDHDPREPLRVTTSGGPARRVPFPLADAYLGPYPYCPLKRHIRSVNDEPGGIPRRIIIQTSGYANQRWVRKDVDFKQPIYLPSALPAAWPEFYPYFGPDHLLLTKLVRRVESLGELAGRNTLYDWALTLRAHHRTAAPAKRPQTIVERVNASKAVNIAKAAIAYEFDKRDDALPAKLKFLLAWPSDAPMPTLDAFCKANSVIQIRRVIGEYRRNQIALGYKSRKQQRPPNSKALTFVKEAFEEAIAVQRLRLMGRKVRELAATTRQPVPLVQKILTGIEHQCVHPAISPELYTRELRKGKVR